MVREGAQATVTHLDQIKAPPSITSARPMTTGPAVVLRTLLVSMFKMKAQGIKGR